MLFKSRDEKRMFVIMNFQKNLEMEMKKDYLRLFDAFGISPSFGTKWLKPGTKNLAN